MSKIVRLKESELVNLIKRVITEQVASGNQVATKPSTPSPIPGFVFAEDDAEWLGPNGFKSTEEINKENNKRLFNYYGLSDGSVINPSALIGKTAFAFKPVADPNNQMQYLKEYLDPRMFTINSISFSPKTKVVSIFSDKIGGSTYMQVLPYSRRSGKILLSSGSGTPNENAFNPVFGSIYDKASTDPKYIKQKI